MSLELERLFLREKPALALLAVGELQPAYAAVVAKRIDSTFPHTSTILAQLEEQGLITSRPEGRIRYLALTERGKIVAASISRLREALSFKGKEWSRLEALRVMVTNASRLQGQSACLRAGPLRRDLAWLLRSEDRELRMAASELDSSILEILGR